jgi:hypothetical protein
MVGAHANAVSFLTLWSVLIVLIYWNKEVVLEVNGEKIKYIFMPHHQNVGQNNTLNYW